MKNREIKVRAWDVINKKMLDPDEFKLAVALPQGHVVGVNIDVEDGEDITTEYELIQYTGLKDKNGKEIWEGDICQAWILKTKKRITGEIQFINGFFGFDIHTRLYDAKICEIIGNIHENPELLK